MKWFWHVKLLLGSCLITHGSSVGVWLIHKQLLTTCHHSCTLCSIQYVLNGGKCLYQHLFIPEFFGDDHNMSSASLLMTYIASSYWKQNYFLYGFLLSYYFHCKNHMMWKTRLRAEGLILLCLLSELLLIVFLLCCFLV